MGSEMCIRDSVFESAGLATVVITRARDVAERMRVPRALHTVFPPGLPLGKPRDKKFQTAVLTAAFELLGERGGPVIREYPVHIYAEDGEPVACALPPQMDPTLHPAVDEAQALRPAYDRALARSKRSSIGCLLYTSPSPRDATLSRMPSSA